MLFDPDDGKTWPEKIESVLNRMPPEYRACVTALAEERGCSIQEIVEKCAVLWLNDMIADSAYRVALHAKEDWQEAPFGRDPLMKKDD